MKIIVTEKNGKPTLQIKAETNSDRDCLYKAHIDAIDATGGKYELELSSSEGMNTGTHDVDALNFEIKKSDERDDNRRSRKPEKLLDEKGYGFEMG